MTKRPFEKVLAACTALPLLLAAPAAPQERTVRATPSEPQAAMSGYIKIPDIDGESKGRKDSGDAHLDYLTITLTKADDHDDLIDIHSVDWTTGSRARAMGERSDGDLVIAPSLSRTKSLLIVDGKFGKCTVGEKATRMIVQYAETEWQLSNVEIVGCGRPATTSARSGSRPTEEVAFYYNKIVFSYAKRDMIMKGKKILEN